MLREQLRWKGRRRLLVLQPQRCLGPSRFQEGVSQCEEEKGNRDVAWPAASAPLQQLMSPFCPSTGLHYLLNMILALQIPPFHSGRLDRRDPESLKDETEFHPLASKLAFGKLKIAAASTRLANPLHGCFTLHHPQRIYSEAARESRPRPSPLCPFLSRCVGILWVAFRRLLFLFLETHWA